MTWTHSICDDCWENQRPGRLPVRVREDTGQQCCFCGNATAGGIYVRHNPAELYCTHDEEED